jgi:hypothetical protein
LLGVREIFVDDLREAFVRDAAVEGGRSFWCFLQTIYT